ncbi:MAG TPA: hypothetical protein VL625_05945 [Patescibacteria group bacterium]|nr:hypothetical protein [Patescibacteria group bacterium]
MKRYIAIAFCVFLAMPQHARAEAEDGKYDALVRTEGGTYRTPVEVRDGEVTVIHFLNAGDMTVTDNGRLKNGKAVAELQDASRVKIQITDPSYSESAGEEENGGE